MPVALALQNARFYESAAHQAKVLEEALKRQEELDRMKDELLQNISHELRTPLALVTGYTQMLRERRLGPLSDEQAEALDIIAHRSTMLRGLVEDITMHWQLENPEQHLPCRKSSTCASSYRQSVREFGNEARKSEITLKTEMPAISVGHHQLHTATTPAAGQSHRQRTEIYTVQWKNQPYGWKI